ncbi:MAG: hypothetical protein HY904_13710 [Deltaproteobacteria bacterium]|nr:hypothetical protein [Deltaproteobacteria bacterium]
MEPNTGTGDGGACGTLEGARAAVTGAASREDLQPLGELVRDKLVRTGKWRQAVRVGLELFREAPPRGLVPALEDLRAGDSLARLAPHARAIIWYVVGSPKLGLLPGEEFAAGPHAGPVRVTADALRVCQPRAVMQLANRVLSVRVPCAGCPSGTRLFASALLDALAALIADPALSQALDGLEFSDEPGRPAAIGRAAFQLFADLLVDGIVSPSFTLQYYESNLRVQVDDVVGRRLAAETRARLDAFLDALGLGLAPELGLLQPLQQVLGCVRRQDPGHEMAGMLFDYIRLESLQWRDFVPNLAATVDSRSGAELNAYLARVTGRLALDETLARDVVGSVLPLLVDGAGMELFAALERLQGTGVTTGMLDFLVRLLGACAQR